MKREPTAEQLAELKNFAAMNGRTWKSRLRHAWETGQYAECGAADYSHLLQQIRNTFGPTWLVNFKLAKEGM